jgi:predicted Abi (CAAX) family protease
MNISFLPRTVPGKWAVGLAIGFIVLFVLLIILVTTGQEGGETFFSNLYLAVPGLLALVSGIAAFVTGVISIIFARERGLVVFLAAAIGLLVIVFMVGDLLFPA